MRRPSFVIAVLLLAIAGAPAVAAEPADTQGYSFGFKFEIIPAKSGKDAGEATLTCVVPRSIVRRQKVVGLNYSQEPAKVWDEKGTRYAHFEFKDLPMTLTINADVDLYRLDFETIERLKDASAAKTTPLDEYLAGEKYLDKDSPVIKRAAAGLKGKDDLDTVRKTLEYVKKNLTYDLRSDPSIPDPIASVALERRRGVCLQFADVFVSLCRANGVHARVCTGYAARTRTEQNERHAWVEAYVDKYGWIPFDPTAYSAGAATFERRPNFYLYLGWRRHDPTLNDRRFWTYRSTAKIDIKESWTINKRVVPVLPARP
jgi:transglutaminase-like putative cysteine protease